MKVSKIDCGRSSWLRSIEYVPFDYDTKQQVKGSGLTGVLVVESQTGAKYAYAVPSWVVGQLAAARSKGRAFGKLIRHRFQSIKLQGASR